MKVAIAMFILITMLPLSSFSGQGQIGTAAPDFSLADLNGKAVTLKQFKGKVVFLTFWESWCTPCRDELPELDALYARYGKDGLEVIGISTETSRSGMVKFLQKVPVTFKVLIDENGAAGDAYRVSGLPTGFIIGRDGVIRHKHVGFGKEFLPMYEKEIVEQLKPH